MGRPSKFPLEFRREAVRLVVTTGKPMAQVAKDLGISDKTLGNWVRTDRANLARDSAPGALAESEREELRRLRAENRELKVEREILRKAAAYFARETNR